MPSCCRLLLLLPLLALSLTARADIYKYYDSDGNLVLSDSVPKQNPERAEKVETKPVMTVPALKTTPTSGRRPPQEAPRADGARLEYVIVVQSPGVEATYQRSGEPIPVAFSIDPALQEGHRVEVLLDGVVANNLSQISTDQLERGAHTLEVNVVDAAGKSLKSVKTTFYIQQHSAQRPPARSGKPAASSSK